MKGDSIYVNISKGRKKLQYLLKEFICFTLGNIDHQERESDSVKCELLWFKLKKKPFPPPNVASNFIKQKGVQLQGQVGGPRHTPVCRQYSVFSANHNVQNVKTSTGGFC